MPLFILSKMKIFVPSELNVIFNPMPSRSLYGCEPDQSKKCSVPSPSSQIR